MYSSSGDVTPSPEGSSIYSTPMATTPVASTPIEAREGGFAYKKDDVDDALFAGVTKKTSRRNSRNERRNSKVIRLHRISFPYKIDISISFSRLRCSITIPRYLRSSANSV